MYTNIKLILGLLLFLAFISCSQNKSERSNDIIKISLIKQETVGPFLRTLMPFTPFEVDSLRNSYYGIPDSDTLVAQELILFNPKRLEALYSSDSITKLQYDNFKGSYFAVAGLNNGKQFYVIDLNRDRDFSNDSRIEFDKILSEKTQNDVFVRDSFGLVNIDYDYFLNGKIVNIQQYVRFFPYKNYFTFREPDEKLNIFSEVQLVSETNEHWLGNFENDDEKFEFAVKSSPQYGEIIVIRDTKSPFRETRNSQYFKHKIGDTLRLNDSYFQIDCLSLSKSDLFMKKLGDLEGYYGYLKGERVKDIRFKDVDGNLLSIKEAFKGKNYLLLDFWGTWCVPCIKLTPELVRLNGENRNFELLSIAFEKSAPREKVKEYLKKNKMTWSSTYELMGNLNEQTSFVHNLKVTSYPTFIVLDKDLKIVYRGFGLNALEEAVSLTNHGKDALNSR